MKKLNLLVGTFLASLAISNAVESPTDAVGYQKQAISRGYTPVSLPLVKDHIAAASVVSKTGPSIVLSSAIPSGANASKPHYLEVTSGPLAGERVDVTISPNSATVTIAPSSENTSDLSTLASGALVEVRQHVTLGDLDSYCSPALVGSDDDNVCDRVLFLVNGAFVHYLKRADGLWYEDGGYEDMSSLPVRPGVGCFVFRKSNTPTTLTQVGNVRATKFARPFARGYQFYAPAYPMDLSPNAMGATASNGWANGERIHIFANGAFVANILDTTDTTGGNGGTWYEDGGYEALNASTLISSSQAAVVWRTAASPGVVETSPVPRNP